MLEYIVTIGLIAGAGCWILYPLLKPDQYKTTPVSRVTESLRQLEVKKDNAYAAIRELEFDYNMGKLSKSDFGSLERRYRADAVRLIEEIDKLQSGHKVDEKTPEADLESQAEGKIIALRKKKSNAAQSIFCVQCGTEVSVPGQFCHSCGERLESVS